MGLSEETEDKIGKIQERYDVLCQSLNLDTKTKDEAWESYNKTREIYTLEGDDLQWLACALYASCRMSRIPAVNLKRMIEGNGVSLQGLLKLSEFSILQFLDKMKKWEDMCNLPVDFRHKVDRLERNFNVCSVLFKKYQPIFRDVFQDPSNDAPKQPRIRKQSRRVPCTVTDVFHLCWTMFVQVKGNLSWMRDELVGCYHLLLCCIDWFYINALLSHRKDLLNPNFKCLPQGYFEADYKVGDMDTSDACIMQYLCSTYDGVVLETKTMKQYTWNEAITKHFQKRVMKGRIENMTAVLDLGNFEYNSKSINKLYDEHILSDGGFDERVFLRSDANIEIGTPQKSLMSSVNAATGDANVRRRSLNFATTAPSTPLTGRGYLKDSDGQFTPISNATQGVSKLRTLLAQRKGTPSDKLVEIFQRCKRNPQEAITKRVKAMGLKFCESYSRSAGPGLMAPGVDFAKGRLQFADMLYYKILEDIIEQEVLRLTAKDKQVDLSNLLEQETFHYSLFACCLEIVLFTYNTQKKFPWLLQVYNLQAYNFYKVIEVLIRAEDGLSREVVKHLNQIEESILESEAWKFESPLWDSIEQHEHELPMCADVTLPSQIDLDNDSGDNTSPVLNPKINSILAAEKGGHPVPRTTVLLSPTGVIERFSTPRIDTVKRSLFDTDSTSKLVKVSNADYSSSYRIETQKTIQKTIRVLKDGDGDLEKAQLVTCAKTVQHGKEVLLPMSGGTTGAASPTRVITLPTPDIAPGSRPIYKPKSGATGPHPPKKLPSPSPDIMAAANAHRQKQNQENENKPKKTGSLALFARKFYHLASVRLRHLCKHLDIDSELRKQTWTCFEWCVVKHSEKLMKDRHLDQILMCSLYVMSRITQKPVTFRDIMTCYKAQPQAQNHVYRSVLLSDRRHKRRKSESSEESISPEAGGKVKAATEDTVPSDGAPNTLHQTTSALTARLSLLVTPSVATGITNKRFGGQDRGDLIKFYNDIFYKEISDWTTKFSSSRDDIMLSPLPLPRLHPISPRKVSSHHSVFISPHKQRPSPAVSGYTHDLRCNTPLSTGGNNNSLMYCIDKSPAKELELINSMVQQYVPTRRVSKRLLITDTDCADPSDVVPNKLKRLQKLQQEREEANNAPL